MVCKSKKLQTLITKLYNRKKLENIFNQLQIKTTGLLHPVAFIYYLILINNDLSNAHLQAFELVRKLRLCKLVYVLLLLDEQV